MSLLDRQLEVIAASNNILSASHFSVVTESSDVVAAIAA